MSKNNYREIIVLNKMIETSGGLEISMPLLNLSILCLLLVLIFVIVYFILSQTTKLRDYKEYKTKQHVC